MNGRKMPGLMTPAEVGEALRVDPKSVTRWAKAGKLRYTRTPGMGGWGHLRCYRAEIEAIAAGEPLTSEQLDAVQRGEDL